MKLIYKYILKNVSLYICLALLVLSAIYFSVELISEFDNLDKGNYSLKYIVLYELYRIPNYLYNTFPLAILIGIMVYLGVLVNNSEYVIIRVNGISVKKLTYVLLFCTFCFTLINIFICEIVLPKTQIKADKIKVTAMYGNYAKIGKTNIWFKLDNQIITVNEVLPDYTLKLVTIREIDNYELKKIIFAEQAIFNKNENFGRLINPKITTFTNDKIEQNNLNELILNNKITKHFLNMTILNPQNMSILSLSKYISYLKNQNQSTFDYEVEFWRKVFYFFLPFVMVLLSFAFIPLSNRYVGIGTRIFFAIIIGVSFNFISRFFSFYAKLFNINPFLSGFLPIMIFIIIVIGIFYKNNRYVR